MSRSKPILCVDFRRRNSQLFERMEGGDGYPRSANAGSLEMVVGRDRMVGCASLFVAVERPRGAASDARLDGRV